MSALQFRLLGPVQLWAHGEPVDVGPARQRAVLAALVMGAGRPVAVETMIARVWGDRPPARARNSLYSYVTRTRNALARIDPPRPQVRLTSRPGGYVLELDEDLVDLYRFRRLTRQAGPGPGDEERRAGLLDEALGLWSGPALADLSGPWSVTTRAILEQQRLDVVLSWAEAQLALGRAGRVIGVLRELLAQNPMIEPLAARLMRALCQAGRTAEALACYAVIRRQLIEALGSEPGAELRALHQSILREELAGPGAGGGAPVIVTADPVLPAVPAQLPLDPPALVGRERELAVLDRLATRPDPVATVVAVWGMAGIGKTALAVHWARRMAAWYPDGQLYLNLRGFDPRGVPLPAHQAVRGFLDALGVAPERIPLGLDAQIGLYRTILARRRVLVLLDNAISAEQVRPLLPGAHGCLALVTSRIRLTSLVAVEGAQPVPLRALPAAAAARLLTGRLGPAATLSTSGASDAVDAIIAATGGLPLALAIVAARATADPGRSLPALAAELRDDRRRLDGLTGGDAASDLRSVFSWSYDRLDPDAAALFRQLGRHPDPEVDAAGLAAVSGADPEQVRRLLAELVRQNLLAEPEPDHFALPVLLRPYAAELAAASD